ncbi:hypothetical protein DB347_17420 [Opitutaceae bacterium EW11]|nr:hypothetical protein DB347_17420 [Opitutaceae bacterium EW11]
MPDSMTLGRDLTAWATSGKLDPMVGRDAEVDLMLRVLCRRTKANPLLLGDPGVGKTALVEGLAQRIVSGSVPLALRGRRLFELQLGALLAGTQYRGDLEKRVQEFLERARLERSIVFIDEIHLLVLAGRGSGMDAANLLKPVLSRGDVPCIGATTPAEAVEMFRVDPALQRRFQAVHVAEPDRAAVTAILRAARVRLEAHHQLEIADDAIHAAVELSFSTPGARKNPDRALDLLEDACAGEQLRAGQAIPARAEPSQRLLAAEAEVRAAVAALDLDRHVRARAALESLEKEERSCRSPARPPRPCVSADQIRASAAGI